MAPLQTAFIRASQILDSHRQYWDFNAFRLAAKPLSKAMAHLNALDEPALWQLDNNPQAQCDYFRPRFPALFDWLNAHEPPLSSVSFTSSHTTPSTAPCTLSTPVTAQNAITQQLPLNPAPFWLHTGIPGRKWQQVESFIAQLNKYVTRQHTSQPALEWCAGKGYLGRLLSWQHNQSVISLEYQKTLCRQGQHCANTHNLAQQFIQTDIHALPLAPNTADPWMALHACGDLHRQFVLNASTHKPSLLAMAPCCYHRQHGNAYLPLSQVGQAHNLQLNTLALRLAQQDQVTAGRSERNKHTKQLNWRLGYEHLRQQAAPNTPYQSLPSIKTQSFTCFEHFCQWAAKRHNITLHTHSPWQAAEQHGEALRLNMMRHDAIRHCFRRMLELWLLMDKALYLQQHHYTVQLHRFCEATLTPRNLLLTATHTVKKS